jgi:hypothetical protein
VELASDRSGESELGKPGSDSNPPQTPSASAITHAASSAKEAALTAFSRRRRATPFAAKIAAFACCPVC